MHNLLKLSPSANPALNFMVSKLSKNSVLGVQMTRLTHRWLSLCYADIDLWSTSSLLVQIYKWFLTL